MTFSAPEVLVEARDASELEARHEGFLSGLLPVPDRRGVFSDAPTTNPKDCRIVATPPTDASDRVALAAIFGAAVLQVQEPPERSVQRRAKTRRIAFFC